MQTGIADKMEAPASVAAIIDKGKDYKAKV